MDPLPMAEIVPELLTVAPLTPVSKLMGRLSRLPVSKDVIVPPRKLLMVILLTGKPVLTTGGPKLLMFEKNMPEQQNVLSCCSKPELLTVRLLKGMLPLAPSVG